HGPDGLWSGDETLVLMGVWAPSFRHNDGSRCDSGSCADLSISRGELGPSGGEVGHSFGRGSNICDRNAIYGKADNCTVGGHTVVCIRLKNSGMQRVTSGKMKKGFAFLDGCTEFSCLGFKSDEAICFMTAQMPNIGQLCRAVCQHCNRRGGGRQLSKI